VKHVAWLALALLLIGGCASKEMPEPESAKLLKNAPVWVKDPDVVCRLSGVGDAAKEIGGVELQKTEAVAKAREMLAQKIQTRTTTLMGELLEEMGAEDTPEAGTVTGQVAEQLAFQLISGSRQKALWVAPDGSLYVLVILDAPEVMTVAVNTIRMNLRMHDALRESYQKKQGEMELLMEGLTLRYFQCNGQERR